MRVFKAYDVRGKYPSQIEEDFARRLGAATARFLGARRVAVGRDVRLSAPSIAAAVCAGIRSTGATAVDFGLITTPMLYYAVGRYGLDGGVMVTASHNPPEDIGFKICREQAYPVGRATGLREIEARMDDPSGGRRGAREERSMVADYRAHIRSFLRNVPKLRIAVDTANGAVGVHFDAVFGDIPGIEWVRLCFEPDGRFPNHEPNPLKDENVRDLQEKMKGTEADLGSAFDG
ncbi:MAG: phosphohexomutase domain-containing protein, partial [Planctomycetota bacterium]